MLYNKYKRRLHNMDVEKLQTRKGGDCEGLVQGMERNCERADGVQERLDVTTAYHATPPGAVSKGEKR